MEQKRLVAKLLTNIEESKVVTPPNKLGTFLRQLMRVAIRLKDP